MPIRAIGLGFLLALSAPAQFFDLAATDDGRLYFWTNLRQKGAPGQSNETKIFRMTGDGFELVASAPIRVGAIPPSVTAPFVNGDGSVYGYNEYSGCGSPSCGFLGLPRNTIKLTGKQFPAGVNPQSGQVSRNGRYFIGNRYPMGVLWIDLETGRTAEIDATRPASVNHAIANDGTALVLRDTVLAIFHPSDATLDTNIDAANTTSAVISPDSNWYAFEPAAAGERQLVLRRRGGRNSTILSRKPLAPIQGFSAFHPTFSNANTLLFLDYDSSTQLHQLAISQGEFAQPSRFAPVPEGLWSAIIAGAGHTGYAVTTSGRLLRVHTAALNYDELLPETPQIAPILSTSVAGSAVRTLASGVTERTELLVGGVRLPLILSGPRFSFFQVPWEAAPDSAPLIASTPGHPFESLLGNFTISARPFIRIERDTYVEGTEFIDIPLIAHEDFRGLVTRDDPARPGETLHIYATALGPVNIPQQTGQPAPANPPARITTPFACYVRQIQPSGRVEGAVLPYVGLAPGLVGFYQIDLVIPRDWPSALTGIECVNSFGARDAVALTVRP